VIKTLLSPPAELSKRDTGLRFTDILFGFVIRELFLRLQNWSELAGYVRWQLIVATVLVLGSWIGFRRSLNRTDYELKFFNIPLWRFVLDQAMLVLYFYIATLTPSSPSNVTPTPSSLAHSTAQIIFVVFALYAAWDILALVMGYLNKYTAAKKDWPGFVITLAGLGLAAALYFLMSFGDLGGARPTTIFILAGVLLLAYRFAKEVRSTVRHSPGQIGTITVTATATGADASATATGATATSKGPEATATGEIATGEGATAGATGEGATASATGEGAAAEARGETATAEATKT
jgi:hypothetical protein